MAKKEATKVIRDYADNFSIKELTTNELIPTYFPDVDVSVRTSGTFGLLTEQISNISEDAFNTASVLFREAFANRAQIDESIYSHAAIFQIDDIFSRAAACRFLMVMDEEAIIQNILGDKENPATYDKDTGIYHFYIGKETRIYVEDKPYVLDYDIRMDIVRKTSTTRRDEWLFTASYIMDEYTNSISDLKDPYVKIRRSGNGYVAMEVMCHQCLRNVEYEAIISNNVVNYPVIDVNFTGKLAGFEILYKSPADLDYNTQLEPHIVYSQPVTTPFCYYQLLNDSTLRITFNTKDNFYMCEFNSDLKIILYITEGAEGNFNTYNGKDISIVPDIETYSYANPYLTAASPLGSSENGIDQVSLDILQSLAVEGYRTANALTTENDLDEYFSNYKYRYGDSDILFIRKRDDVHERVYSAYILMKNEDYIYKTNTLNLHLNLSDMVNSEQNVYIFEPGWLFTANEANGYANIYRDPTKSAQYYEEYQTAIENNEIPFVVETIDREDIPAYLDRPASFAEYKARHNLEDKVMVFDADSKTLESLDDADHLKFLMINPFLIRFKKNPNLVSAYMTYVSETYLLDFTEINRSSYVQFILYSMEVVRKFEKAKKYTVTLTLAPSIMVSTTEYPIIQVDHYDDEGEPVYIVGDRYITNENDLRVFLVMKNDVDRRSCFVEMVPVSYDNETQNFTFQAVFYTDDHITSSGKMRLLDDTIYRNKDTGIYYKVYEDDKTLYNMYNADDEIIATDIPVDNVTEMYNSGELYKFENVHNMTSASDILIPMEDVICEVYTCYNRIYSEETGMLELISSSQTNNIFADYMSDMKGYFWTNEYHSDQFPVTFMKPLDNLRIALMFEDFTEATYDENDNVVFTHDIMDANMYNIPFIKYDIGLNEELIDYFMRSFYNQYNFLTEIINVRLRNATALDTKFYNTYGRSLNFYIGEDKEVIDTVDLKLTFDIYYVNGTEFLTASQQVKDFIKKEVETINERGQNNLYISNLMRKIENTFAFVDHIKFSQINDYDTEYQAVRNKSEDLRDLTVEERRWYVPEFLTADLDRIILNEYYADDENKSSK